MDNNNSKRSHLDKVSAESWRSEFLERIASLPGFVSLAESSCDACEAPSVDMGALNVAAKELIQTYDKEELVVARQHYNNEHVLEYWLYYNRQLDVLSESGIVDRGFPLFEIEVDLPRRTYRAAAVSLDQLNDDSVLSNVVSPGRPVPVPQKGLERLLAKLVVMQRIQNSTYSKFYPLLLNTARDAGNTMWDYYKIHYFLDNNLYEIEDGVYYRSPFSFVFFNHNVIETRLFLEHCLSNAVPLTLSEVGTFLKRQREQHLRLAVNVSSAENEIHNRRRDLYYYDPADEVVKDQFTPELTDYFLRTIVEPCGIIKQDGCPFARTKGLQKNALVEVFEHFDKMILHLMENSVEFSELCSADYAQACKST